VAFVHSPLIPQQRWAMCNLFGQYRYC
jgi:hypothetical protein